MHKVMVLFVTAACCAALTMSASGQECGDANDDGEVSFIDPIMILDHVAISSVPINENAADCDGRVGVTIADAQTLLRYLFASVDERECDGTADYSFAAAPNDVVYLPYMLGIDAGIDSVRLPVRTSLETNTEALYLSLSGATEDWGGYFYPDRIEQQMGTAHQTYQGVWVMFANEIGPFEFDISGERELITIVLYRIQPGVGSIVCQTAPVDAVKRTSVEKGTGDLFVPTIEQYEVASPVTQVNVDPTALSFSATAGGSAHVNRTVTITANQGAVSFDLTVADDWVIIDDYQAGGYTTPVTITVTASASSLVEGTYGSSIDISNPILHQLCLFQALNIYFLCFKACNLFIGRAQNSDVSICLHCFCTSINNRNREGHGITNFTTTHIQSSLQITLRIRHIHSQLVHDGIRSTHHGLIILVQ